MRVKRQCLNLWVTKMNKLIIIGASGHGKVVADIAKLNGYNEIVFLDDNPDIKECFGYSVLGLSEKISEIDGDVFVAIGNSDIRKKIMDRYNNRTYPVLIHPASVIADNAVIGKGTVVMAGVVINPDSFIGDGCIVNTSSSIDHDCEVGNYCHISVGSHLCGTVKLGDNIWVGAGAIISNNINICSDAYIGAGAVVVNDIKDIGTYIGIPAKVMIK